MTSILRYFTLLRKVQYDNETSRYDKGFVGMTKIYKYDKEFVILSLLQKRRKIQRIFDL